MTDGLPVLGYRGGDRDRRAAVATRRRVVWGAVAGAASAGVPGFLFVWAAFEAAPHRKGGPTHLWAHAVAFAVVAVGACVGVAAAWRGRERTPFRLGFLTGVAVVATCLAVLCLCPT